MRLCPFQNKTCLSWKNSTRIPQRRFPWRSWSELAQAKVPENNQDHHDYTDNVKYVVSTHVLSHFAGRLPFANTVVDCPEASMPYVL